MNMNMPVLEKEEIMSVSGGESSIGQLLLDMGKITNIGAERVLHLQKERGLRFGEAAQMLGLITEDDIRQVLARQFDYPYLKAHEGGFSPQLVAAYQPFSPEVEAYRAVRSQLMTRHFSGARKMLAVMALDAASDASVIAANLAVVFSQLGERTLLIEANLRQPKQRALFNLQGRAGLSDVLAGRAGAEAVCKIGEFRALSVLQAGTVPPNPQELLNRVAFSQVNDKLSNDHDVLLYDVPPADAGADAFNVAAFCGGVLLVVRKNATRVASVRAVVEHLERSRVAIVGSIMLDK